MSESDDPVLKIQTRKTFQTVDYVLFSLTLAVSASIGLYHAIKDKNKKNTQEFMLAGRKMAVLPVSLSLLSSFVSAITILGAPAEIYTFGTMFVWFGISYGTSLIFAVHVYLPIFYNLGVTSVYEYLEKRFNFVVRTACSLAYCIQTILLMAIVLYAPSLALNSVTGFTLWGSVCAVGAVCTLYTMLGGMKAVLWTDTFQVMVMLLGLLAVLIKGSLDFGMGRAWHVATERGRIEFDDFSFDPTVRHTVWSLVIGGTCANLAIYGTNQSQVQRTLTLPSLKKSQIAVWLNFPSKVILVYICCLIGVLMFAFYADCDPLSTGQVKAKDQLFPLFVMDVLGGIPGIPGLFVACLFSGALSTLSSGLNSMSAVIIQDVVRVFIAKDIKEEKALLLAKVLVLFLGAASLGLSYVASLMGGILQAAISLDGAVGGTLLGVFTLGMIFPWANSKGAIAGLISGLTLLLWISVGAKVVKPPIQRPPLPVSISGCLYENSSLVSNFTTHFTNNTIQYSSSTTAASVEIIHTVSNPVHSLYTISYLWYACIAIMTVIVVGLVVSFITGHTIPSSIDPKLMCPWVDIFCPCLPEKIKKPLRFGVQYEGKGHAIDVSDIQDPEKTVPLYGQESARPTNEHDMPCLTLDEHQPRRTKKESNQESYTEITRF